MRISADISYNKKSWSHQLSFFARRVLRSLCLAGPSGGFAVLFPDNVL
jgi:hypothetical protein